MAIGGHDQNGESGAGMPEDNDPFEAASQDEAQTGALPLGDEERLPWLESADDVDFEDGETDGGRIIGLAVVAIVALALLIGGIYWFTHRGGASRDADGSLIVASKTPYKVAPTNPGGKTFEGTGDTSFKVSEGEKPQAKVAQPASAPAPEPSATQSAAPSAQASPADLPGVGVQVGAYFSTSSAEAGWRKLSADYEALKDFKHRIVEGQADIGKVYRLQAVASDRAAANTLCGKLRADGLSCQVK
ncbi:SPOR domain-containing protein [Novosphingobium sp. ZN18A2]|uniref:SPOR domain-containing protein n=1 Tax=Novosphingobium sp. ZN18A2 TaxID=3079861 RepID=UPI0030CDB0AB